MSSHKSWLPNIEITICFHTFFQAKRGKQKVHEENAIHDLEPHPKYPRASHSDCP
jgi:hypothetical protein